MDGLIRQVLIYVAKEEKRSIIARRTLAEKAIGFGS